MIEAKIGSHTRPKKEGSKEGQIYQDLPGPAKSKDAAGPLPLTSTNAKTKKKRESRRKREARKKLGEKFVEK